MPSTSTSDSESEYKYIPIGCAFLAFIFYALTAAPTISWGDSADLALRLVYQGDTSFTGTHRDYPIWRFFGQTATWLPIKDAGLRANLFTALWGAVTIGAVVWLIQTISQSVAAALAAGIALSVAHTFWLLSVIAEVYTFNAALVMLTFACIAKWWNSGSGRWLWLAGITCGLSLAHHATGLVLAASITPLILARFHRIKSFDGMVAIAIFVGSSLPYWSDAMPRLASGMPLLEALSLKMSQNINFEISPIREFFKFSAYLSYNFFGLSLLLIGLGSLHGVQKKIWPALPPMIWAAAFIYAGITSSIPDKFNVYILIYPCFALLVGLGVAWLESRNPLSLAMKFGALISIAATPTAAYYVTAHTSKQIGIDLVGARQAPLRDNDLYFLWPPKNGDFGARVFAEQALRDTAPNGILIADYTLWRPIYFIQAIEGMRPDVKLTFVERLLSKGVDGFIAEQTCDTPIFLATDHPQSYYQLDRIRERYTVKASGSIFEVKRDCKSSDNTSSNAHHTADLLRAKSITKSSW